MYERKAHELEQEIDGAARGQQQEQQLNSPEQKHTAAAAKARAYLQVKNI